MKAVGVVAEFDPFHKGHERFLRESIEQTGADRCVVVMSGAFTQRGECAAFDAASRAEAALRCGADVVLEMPVRTACSGAGDFTRGSVYALDSLGCVDCISFGSESGDIHRLSEASKILSEIDEEEVNSAIPHRTFTYAGALDRYLEERGRGWVRDLIGTPNNVLGTGYLSALSDLGSRIRPFTVKRDREDRNYASSSDIRKAVAGGDVDFVSRYVPREMFELIPEYVFPKREEAGKASDQEPGMSSSSDSGPDPSCLTSPGLIGNDDFSLPLFNEIISHSAEELSGFYECSEDLARRIKKLCRPGMSFTELVKTVKTKELTESRVRRVFAHIVLGLTGGGEDPEFLRLLGYKRGKEDVLSLIRKNSSVPVITRNAEAKLLSGPAKRSYEETIRSHRLREEAWYLRYGTLPKTSDRVIVTEFESR